MSFEDLSPWLNAAVFAAAAVVVWGAGISSWLMLASYLAAIRLLAHSRASQAWRAVGRNDQPPRSASERSQGSMQRLIVKTVIAGALILVAGFFLARTGESLAEQTGLSTSFFGTVLLAIVLTLLFIVGMLAP